MSLICQKGFGGQTQMLVVFNNQNRCHVNPLTLRSRSNRLPIGPADSVDGALS
jgi:hypothetical protein